jgi:hypothetical protein
VWGHSSVRLAFSKGGTEEKGTQANPARLGIEVRFERHQTDEAHRASSGDGGAVRNLATTQRYVHLTPTALDNAIRLLDSPSVTAVHGNIAETAEGQDRKVLSEGELDGVGDGVRTRDFRSHSPALCH